MKIEEARRVTIDFSGPPDLLRRLVEAWGVEYGKVISEALKEQARWAEEFPPEDSGRRVYPPLRVPVYGSIRYRLKPAKRDR